MGILGRAIGTLAAAALVACGGDGSRRYEAEGVVEGVQADRNQVLIAHEDIPGLMPAMTMNFDVPDPAVLEGLEPGHVIDFTIEFTGRSYHVVEVAIRDRVEPREGYALLGDKLMRADPAPAFQLIDQGREPLALGDLKGKVLLVDFIFTQCPGPCPILTGLHASVQKSLPEGLRDRIHFVSISLDPLNDTPEALTSYARARGAQLDNWSFLTGPVAEVEKVVAAYGIGTTRSPEGELTHIVASFLIDPEGRIVKRYLGLEHEPQDLVRDLSELAS